MIYFDQNYPVIIPPYLKKADRIGLVCPAGFMLPEKFQSCLEQLIAWGYEPVLGSTMHSRSVNYFSGSDKERLEDFQRMLDDDSIAAVLCGRGGYGMSRIIDGLDLKKFSKKPKWVIGFSDITAFHAHIGRQYRIAGLHAPMAAAFNDGGFSNNYVQSLRKALEGRKADYETGGHALNRMGNCAAKLVGGNLTLLAHLIGTKSEPKVKGRILFLEDVGEYIYNIDRMFLQLKRAGWLENLGGLLIGGFTETKDTERPFGQTAYQLIHDHLKGCKFPIAFGFPVSHDRENYALKTGVDYRLTVDREKVRLTEK